MLGNWSEGLLVRAEPLRLAEEICRRLVWEVQVVDDALWLGAAPAWSGAVNIVLIKKGVRVSELVRLASDSDRMRLAKGESG
jgi:hypothetical protein